MGSALLVLLRCDDFASNPRLEFPRMLRSKVHHVMLHESQLGDYLVSGDDIPLISSTILAFFFLNALGHVTHDECNSKGLRRLISSSTHDPILLIRLIRLHRYNRHINELLVIVVHNQP